MTISLTDKEVYLLLAVAASVDPEAPSPQRRWSDEAKAAMYKLRAILEAGPPYEFIPSRPEACRECGCQNTWIHKRWQ